MDPSLSSGVWALAVAVAGVAVAWFFKSPKESQNEMAVRVGELEDKHDILEGKHHALDRDYAGFQEHILAELRNLASAINRLSDILGDKGKLTSGEHRALRGR